MAKWAEHSIVWPLKLHWFQYYRTHLRIHRDRVLYFWSRWFLELFNCRHRKTTYKNKDYITLFVMDGSKNPVHSEVLKGLLKRPFKSFGAPRTNEQVFGLLRRTDKFFIYELDLIQTRFKFKNDLRIIYLDKFDLSCIHLMLILILFRENASFIFTSLAKWFGLEKISWGTLSLDGVRTYLLFNTIHTYL